MNENSASMIPTYDEPFPSILIFGPPGAGKGTLGKFLSTAGNHFHLSSGDIFRGLDPETPIGNLYHTFASKGHSLTSPPLAYMTDIAVPLALECPVLP